LEETIAATGLPPNSLELEITENIALNGNAATLAPLRKLRDLSVQIALDDFGTGYASLSFLTQMPLSRIKIDQSFVRGLPDDPKLVAIVRSLIAMAHNLGLGVDRRRRGDRLASKIPAVRGLRRGARICVREAPHGIGIRSALEGGGATRRPARGASLKPSPMTSTLLVSSPPC
jgi:hypothetical protein